MKIEIPKYTPSVVDLAWARQMVELTKNGGIIGYPSSKLFYRVWHQNKEIILENEKQLFNFDSFLIHCQSIDVFEEIGYTVLPGREGLCG